MQNRNIWDTETKQRESAKRPAKEKTDNRQNDSVSGKVCVIKWKDERDSLLSAIQNTEKTELEIKNETKYFNSGQ